MLIVLIIAICIFLLVKSAEVFVDQASSLAKMLKVNDFIIGFTVVAFGTSLPELISTLFSVFAGHGNLAVANIVGSNITNLCLIFGLVAVYKNYRIRKRDVDINIPLNMAGLLAFWVLAVYMDFNLNWAAGVSMLSMFALLFLVSREYNHFQSTTKTYSPFNPVYLLASLAVLVGSGKLGVDQIISLANQTGISETLLGYFLLAIGTSLPELVTTWVAVQKHDGELGMGNILGSNLFNLLFVLGVASFVRPVEMTGFVYDMMFLTGITLMVYVLAILGMKYSFSRKEGVGLLVIYLAFAIFRLWQ